MSKSLRLMCISLIAAGSFGLTVAIAGAGVTVAAPSVGGCTMFPANNVWNTPVDNLPVDLNSDQYVAAIGATANAHADFGSSTDPSVTIGIPFNIVPLTQTLVAIQYGAFGNESDPGPFPIPPDALVESGTDAHLLVLRQGDCKLFELYNAAKQLDNSWTADSGAVFTLTVNGPLRQAGWTSADAAGLPMLPGLARYDEVASGAIYHALRFTSNTTKDAYIWPARHSAPFNATATSPPMGQRFRLKAGFAIDGRFSPQTTVILQALKRYGMLLADNGASWYISGAPDPGWDNAMLHELALYVKGSDFEAVDESSLMVNANSGQVWGHAWLPDVMKP